MGIGGVDKVEVPCITLFVIATSLKRGHLLYFELWFSLGGTCRVSHARGAPGSVSLTIRPPS